MLCYGASIICRLCCEGYFEVSAKTKSGLKQGTKKENNLRHNNVPVMLDLIPLETYVNLSCLVLAMDCLARSCVEAQLSRARPRVTSVRRPSIFAVRMDDEDNPLMSPKLVRE